MKFYIVVLLSVFLLFGCQNTQNNIYNDSEQVYLMIKSNIEQHASLTDNQLNSLKEYQNMYINNYKDYPKDQELIGNMEKLINSYNLYFYSIEQNNDEAINMYKQRLNKALMKLNNQFKN